ncbi:MAG: S-layer protein, partial [Candidatus Nanohaloarchaea archaeon]
EVFTASLPDAQSTSGMAVTGTDGELSAEGGGGSGSVTSSSPTYEFADGALDSDENVGQAKQDENLILVGGPNVNSLVQELVDDNQTMDSSEYTEGEGMVQMVDGFSEGQSALVVAGHSGEDTRAAGEFLADYRNNEADLEGESEVAISTETGSVVN